MKIVIKLKFKIRKFLKSYFKFKDSIQNRISPVRYKEMNELNFWRSRKEEEGVLNHNHYKYFYTTHFGLSAAWNGQLWQNVGSGWTHWLMNI